MYAFPVLPSWHMQVFSIEDVKAIWTTAKVLTLTVASTIAISLEVLRDALNFVKLPLILSTTGLTGLMRWPRQPTEGAI